MQVDFAVRWDAHLGVTRFETKLRAEAAEPCRELQVAPFLVPRLLALQLWASFLEERLEDR